MVGVRLDGRGLAKGGWLVLLGGWQGTGRGLIGEVGSMVAVKVITRFLGRGWELRILRGVVRWGLVGWIGFAKLLKFICSCERNMCEHSLWIFKQNHSIF